MAGIIETWEKQIREFEQHGGRKLDDSEKTTGLQRIMPEKGELREWLYMREDSLHTYSDWRREVTK